MNGEWKENVQEMMEHRKLLPLPLRFHEEQGWLQPVRREAYQ